MSTRRVIVVGLGKRVREAVLPALHRAPKLWEVTDVLARTERDEVVDGRSYRVRPLATLDRAALDGDPLVYLAVGKDAVPGVLRSLSSLEPSDADLLIDTPIVRFKHFHHHAKTRAFRAAWVPEDCAYLPWFDAVRMAAQDDTLGTPTRVHFDRSAYAYHGLASGKALLAAGRVRSGRRVRDGNRSVRHIELVARGAAPTGSVTVPSLDSGAAARRTLVITEPRDYSSGTIRIDGTAGSVSDRTDSDPDCAALVAEYEERDNATRISGFRCGDHRCDLDDDERALTSGVTAGQSVIALQEACKRVGLLRLLRDVHAGRGAYPLLDGLDDMVVDYHLEKVGRYIAQPLTSARSPLARTLLGTLSRAIGR